MQHPFGLFQSGDSKSSANLSEIEFFALDTQGNPSEENKAVLYNYTKSKAKSHRPNSQGPKTTRNLIKNKVLKQLKTSSKDA
jgi:hypothetical protein